MDYSVDKVFALICIEGRLAESHTLVVRPVGQDVFCLPNGLVQEGQTPEQAITLLVHQQLNVELRPHCWKQFGVKDTSDGKVILMKSWLISYSLVKFFIKNEFILEFKLLENKDLHTVVPSSLRE